MDDHAAQVRAAPRDSHGRVAIIDVCDGKLRRTLPVNALEGLRLGAMRLGEMHPDERVPLTAEQVAEGEAMDARRQLALSQAHAEAHEERLRRAREDEDNTEAPQERRNPS